MTLNVRKTDQSKTTKMGRRSFLGGLFAVSGTTVGVLLVAPLARFIGYPLRKSATQTEWSDLGPVEDFASITTPVAKTITLERRDAWEATTTQTAVYVLPPKNGRIRVLSPICPHLGCSVVWRGDHNQFICPCHTGKFSPDGTHVSGPPPRSMDSLESKVENGRLKVHYQYFRQLVPHKEVMA